MRVVEFVREKIEKLVDDCRSYKGFYATQFQAHKDIIEKVKDLESKYQRSINALINTNSVMIDYSNLSFEIKRQIELNEDIIKTAGDL